MKIVITGGHHSSAVPFIHKIQKEHPDIQLLWVGHIHSLKGDSNESLEYKEIIGLNIPFYELQAGKIYRTFSFSSFVKIPQSLFASFRYLRKVKPDLILSFGGYIAAPVVAVGWVLGIPSITHEQTTVVGYANKFISLFASKILISWRDSAKYFPSRKVVYTGLPLRDSVFNVNSNEFDAGNNLPYILVTAGKSGSTKINKALEEALPQLLMFSNVIHQCGDYSVLNDYERLSRTYAKIKNALTGKYFLRKFIYENEVGEAFAKAKLVVGRSGAHTIAEILALNKPALFIPIPWVSHHEQQNNAELAKKEGLAEILLEKDLTGTALLEKVKYMLRNIPLYKVSSATNYKAMCVGATNLIINEVLKFERREKQVP